MSLNLIFFMTTVKSIHKTLSHSNIRYKNYFCNVFKPRKVKNSNSVFNIIW